MRVFIPFSLSILCTAWMANTLPLSLREPSTPDRQCLFRKFIDHRQLLQPFAIYSAIHDKIVAPDKTGILGSQRKRVTARMALVVLLFANMKPILLANQLDAGAANTFPIQLNRSYSLR